MSGRASGNVPLRLSSSVTVVCFTLSGGCVDHEDVVARWDPVPSGEEPEPPTEPEPPEPEEPEPEPPDDPWVQPDREPRLLQLSGSLDASDSALIEIEGRYYLLHTGPGIPTKHSDDLLHWERGTEVFETYPSWIAELVPSATSLWAPDIVLFGGYYHLYYSASSFGSSRSCIGHATLPAVPPPALNGDLGSADWTDRGNVICSNLEGATDDFDAIDPHVLVADDGQIWMTFGSYWSGIQLIRLDESGARADDEIVNLASRQNSNFAVQAPLLLQRQQDFFLVISVDLCCRGVSSTRSTVMGRADDVAGPFVDRDEVPLLESGGTTLVSGNSRWRGPGGSNVFQHRGRSYLIFHSYDAERDGQSTLRISELFWDLEGWPWSAGP